MAGRMFIGAIVLDRIGARAARETAHGQPDERMTKRAACILYGLRMPAGGYEALQ